jgi:hypothetical protein
MTEDQQELSEHQEHRISTREFKLEAVRLSESSEKTVAQIARDLGVPERVLYRRRHELREQADLRTRGSRHTVEPRGDEAHDVAYQLMQWLNQRQNSRLLAPDARLRGGVQRRHDQPLRRATRLVLVPRRRLASAVPAVIARHEGRLAQ